MPARTFGGVMHPASTPPRFPAQDVVLLARGIELLFEVRLS